jgi:glycosyltransferase involved in cell wall biosynthesis
LLQAIPARLSKQYKAVTRYKNDAVVVWSEGFPYKLSAFNEKNSLLGKSLSDAGYNVYLTSKLPFQNDHRFYGLVDNINYISTHKKDIKPSKTSYFFSVIKELHLLNKLQKKHDKTFLIASYTSFIVFIIYAVFCKICKIKLILNIMEWHISVYKTHGIAHRINAYLFDRLANVFSSGSIVISDFIYNEFIKMQSSDKIIKIPILTDIKQIDQVSNKSPFQFNFFLYCAGIGYIEAFNVIKKSFQIFHDKNPNTRNHLVLILQGPKSEIELVRQTLTDSKLTDLIHVLSEVTYEALIQLYKNADILLVPLQNTIQDAARYPQKIAAYSACRKPILTNSVGQVGIDFQHGTDVFFADDFTAAAFADAYEIILNNKVLTETISTNARKKCETSFNYTNYTNKLDEFFKKL